MKNTFNFKISKKDIIFIAVYLLLLIFLICTIGIDNSSAQEGESLEIEQSTDEPEIESEIKLDYIPRYNGYNSIALKFVSNGLVAPMDISEYAIYSESDAYYSIDDAIESGIILNYNEIDSNGYTTMLLRTGYTFNGKFTPANIEDVAGYKDSKSNYPFEIYTSENGDKKLTEILVYLNYLSDIVESRSEITVTD